MRGNQKNKTVLAGFYVISNVPTSPYSVPYLRVFNKILQFLLKNIKISTFLNEEFVSFFFLQLFSL